MWTFLGTFVLAAVLPIAALPQNTGTSSGPFTNARLTFYTAGLGACGQTNSDSDFIVALNAAQYGNGEYCNKQITITVNGVSHDATIMDKCPGCPYGGLDLTPTLFSALGNEAAGVLTGEWSFKDGSSGGSSASGSTSTSGGAPTSPSSTGGTGTTGGSPSSSSPLPGASSSSASVPGGTSTTVPGATTSSASVPGASSSSTSVPGGTPSSSSVSIPGIASSPTLAPGVTDTASPTLAPGAESSPTLPAGVTSPGTSSTGATPSSSSCNC